MKKVLCLLLSALLFSGCAAGEKEIIVTENKGSYPMTVVDQVGREVVLEKEPESIISNYYISTSMLIALDQDEKLVGVENNADLRPVYELSAEHILELPGMGTVKEFDLLHLLMKNRGAVLTREKLLNSVWELSSEIESRTVDVHIRTLRQKLGVYEKNIETIRGVGYKFV